MARPRHSLRNVRLRTTFFHDGGLTTLGVPLHVDPGALLALVPIGLQGAGGGAGVGHATLLVPLPMDPGLVGLSLFGQWFVWDGGAAFAAVTAGARITFL